MNTALTEHPLVPWLHSLPSHWVVAALKRRLVIRNGATPTSSEPNFWDGDIPWITPSDLGKSLDPIMTAPSRYITEAGYQNCGTTKVPFGSVIISTRAPIGSLAIAGVETCFNQGCKGLIPDEGTLSKYVFYCFTAFTEVLQLFGEGTTFKELATSRLADFHLCFPPLDEQVTIAAFLDVEIARIDALISDKNRLIDTLREFRGSVVRTETSGLERRGRRRETGNQFMPTVPEEWDFVPLYRYAAITNGSTPLKDNLAFWENGNFPWVNSSVVNRDEVTEGSELVTEDALRLCHLPIVPPGSVLVALTGQGKTRGQATVLRISATINQHLAAVICEEDQLDGEFLFWVLSGQYAALRMISDGQGGTKGALTCDELARFPVPKPPIEEQRTIASALNRKTKEIDGLIDHVRREITLLQELRASTITDAVLGRIDVRSHTKGRQRQKAAA
jgi:type I restriction enzyme, S subunit